MPAFAVVVLIVALLAVVAMVVVRSRSQRNPRARSKQRANRENADARGSTWAADFPDTEPDTEPSDDAPRMPMGDLPPRPSRRRL